MKVNVEREDDLRYDNEWSIAKINAHIVSPSLRVSDEWVLELTQLPSEGGGLYRCDLRDLSLPANFLANRAISLVDHPAFAGVIVMLVDNYLGRSSNSHSRSIWVRSTIRIASYFLEFLWNNDCTSLKAVPQTLFDKFATNLSSGGLLEALSIKSRMAQQNMGLQDECASRDAARTLGTNYLTFLAAIRNENDKSENEDDSSSVSASALHDIFSVANFLFDIPGELSLPYRPYPKAFVLSRLLGNRSESTKNLSNEKAGKLLRVSFLWLYERAPLLLSLLREMIDATINHKMKSRKQLGRTLPQIFAVSEFRKGLEKLLPFPLVSLDISRGRDESHSLREALTSLLTACFILIAFMNARRKSEVSHRYIGLQENSLRVIDEEMELYVVTFFLQKKRHQARVPYFVNRATRDAIGVLMDLQAEFQRLDDAIPPNNDSQESAAAENQSLFRYRRFSVAHGVNKKATMFNFASTIRSSDSRSLMVEALGKDVKIDGQTQVFRRMYAIMNFYRYEDASIQALSYQMGHEFITTTGAYIGDSLTRPEFQSVFDISSADVEALKRAAYADAADLNKYIEDAGNEKLMEEVLGVLNGGKYSGGYRKVINRLALKVAGMASFHGDIEDQAEVVLHNLKSRGHFPKPMKHGQCFLGGSEKKKSAHCFSKIDGAVHRERASPEVCGKCVFHLTKAAYVQNLVNDNEKQRKRLREGHFTGLQRRRVQLECDNLDSAIHLLRTRLEIEHENKEE